MGKTTVPFERHFFALLDPFKWTALVVAVLLYSFVSENAAESRLRFDLQTLSGGEEDDFEVTCFSVGHC